MQESTVVGLEGLVGSVGLTGWNRPYDYEDTVDLWGRHPLLRDGILSGWI